jgi:hypothetical protein
MLGMTVTLSVVRDLADAELDGCRVGSVAEDCTQLRVPLVKAWAVRFEGRASALSTA